MADIFNAVLLQTSYLKCKKSLECNCIQTQSISSEACTLAAASSANTLFRQKEKMWDFFEKIKIVLDISEMVCYYNKALKNVEYIAG